MEQICPEPHSLYAILNYPKGPSTQLVGFQGPKTIQSMILGPETLLFGYLDPLGYGSGAMLLPRSSAAQDVRN